jgi:outer membrane protein OmpA-like peptidoglycan-associated protein
LYRKKVAKLHFLLVRSQFFGGQKMKKFGVGAAFGFSVALLGLTPTPSWADDAGTASVQVAQAAAPMSPGWFAWAPHDWTGIYIGPQVGYNIGHTKVEYQAGPTSTNRTNDVPMGGFTAGFDLQAPGASWGWGTPSWLVAGLELNADLINGTSSAKCPNPAFVCTSGIDWLATLGPRVGYATGPLLVYGTGGFAVAQTRATTMSTVPTTAAAGAGGTKTAYGWFGGAGLQYAASDAISLRIEDDYFRVAANSTQIDSLSALDTVKVTNYGNIIRLALVFQFLAPTPPPAPTPVVAPPQPPAAVAPAKQTFIVFFEFDKSSLTADGKKVVDAAAAAFKSGKSDIAIAGYTDLAGTQQYNLALSKRRADTVKAALVRDGVPAAAIGESWYGKENPRVPTADGVREPQNRRVEIKM